MASGMTHDIGLRGFRVGSPGVEGYSEALRAHGQAVPRASIFHEPGVDGFGETYGNYAQAREDAAERDRQDISDLRNTVGLMNDIRTYNQGVAVDPLALQEAQDKAETARLIRQEAELKMQDLMARRKRRDAAIDSVEFMGIKEALDNGVVEKDTLEEMNLARQEAGLPFVSAMGFDPETGKIMVFDEQGAASEYDRVGTLASFIDAYPEYEDLADIVLPKDVAQRRAADAQALYKMQEALRDEERYRQRMADERIDRLARINDRKIDRLMDERKMLMDMNPVEGDEAYLRVQEIDKEIKGLDEDTARLYGIGAGGQGGGDDAQTAQVPQVTVAQPGVQAVDWKALKGSGK